MSEVESNFSFVDDDILRANLDITFNVVVKLVAISTNKNNSAEFSEELKSSIRKQIIISTASIIEGLTLYVLKKHKTLGDFDLKVNEFKTEKILHKLDDGSRIVLGRDVGVVEKCRFDKLNLGNMIDLCKKHAIFNKDIISNLEKVRNMRNKQHLGSLKSIDASYTEKELEYIFSVAKEIKQHAKKVSMK